MFAGLSSMAPGEGGLAANWWPNAQMRCERFDAPVSVDNGRCRRVAVVSLCDVSEVYRGHTSGMKTLICAFDHFAGIAQRCSFATAGSAESLEVGPHVDGSFAFSARQASLLLAAASCWALHKSVGE